MLKRLSESINTIERLEKWNGHLYNWYDVTSTLPLNPKFVSTVDSGNFVGYLYVVKNVLEENNEEEDSNQIFLDGYICKEAVYRKTPLGREIADLLVAVNRSYGKSDYIPCICWGRNARFASTFEVGTHVQIWGRIQSREYVKKISETEVEQRIAYEVSVSKIEI